MLDEVWGKLAGWFDSYIAPMFVAAFRRFLNQVHNENPLQRRSIGPLDFWFKVSTSLNHTGSIV